MRIALLLALPLCLLAAVTWSASTRIEGPARVIDGDTLWVGSTKVRLAVVDTPERDQTCDVKGKLWRCGDAGSEALAALIGNAPVTCSTNGARSYDRIVAVCTARGVNLNLALVEGGHGIVLEKFLSEWPEYARGFTEAEARARGARRGVWGANALSPAAHRAAGS